MKKNLIIALSTLAIVLMLTTAVISTPEPTVPVANNFIGPLLSDQYRDTNLELREDGSTYDEVGNVVYYKSHQPN